MAANLKLDKETLIKHRFWFLSGLVLLLWLISFIPIFGIKGTITKNAGEAEKAKTALNSAQNDPGIRGPKDLQVAEEKRLDAGKKRDVLTFKVFANQNRVRRNADEAVLDGLRQVDAVLKANLAAPPKKPEPKPAPTPETDTPIPEPEPAPQPPGPPREFKDEQRVFAPHAVEQINLLVAGIKLRHNIDVGLDVHKTIPQDKQEAHKSVPANDQTAQTKFFNDWAKERFTGSGFDGIFIFYCEEPRFFKVDVGADTKKKAFTDTDRDRLLATLWNGVTKPGGGLRVLVEVGNPIVTWPDWLPSNSLNRLRVKDFGEPIKDELSTEYVRNYMKQFEELYEIVNPGTKKLVDFPVGGAKDDQIAALLRPHKFPANHVVTTEEGWTIQEQLAIQRELLRVVREVNDIQAVLKPEWREVAIPEPPKVAKPKDDPNAVATPPSTPTPMAPVAGDPTMTPGGEEKKEPPPPPAPIDRRRFLNTTWTYGVIDDGKRGASWWENGWALDLELSPQGEDVVLQGTAYNLSMEHPIPAAKVRVVLSDADDDRGREIFLDIDAGDLKANPADYRKYKLDTISQRKLFKEPVKLPHKGIKRIVRLQPVPVAPVFDHQRFANPHWLVDVQLVPGTGAQRSLKGKVYNRSGRYILPVNFELFARDDRGDPHRTDLKIGGDAFKAGEHRPFDLSSAGQSPAQIVQARQVLDARTVPVKAIYRMEVGTALALADRISDQRLYPYDFGRKDPFRKPAEPAAGGGGGGGEGFGPQAPPGGASAGPGGASAGTGGGGDGPGGGGGNWLHRYVKEQGVEASVQFGGNNEVRRLPVAMVLIIEQAYKADVEAAFVNSRLRILPTQTIWARWTPPQANVGAFGVRTDEETSLIEVQLYGLATIYEDPEAWDRIQKAKKAAE